MRRQHLFSATVLLAAAVLATSCSKHDHKEPQPAWSSTTDSSLPLPPGAQRDQTGDQQEEVETHPRVIGRSAGGVTALSLWACGFTIDGRLPQRWEVDIVRHGVWMHP